MVNLFYKFTTYTSTNLCDSSRSTNWTLFCPFCPTCVVFAKSFYRLSGCLCSVGIGSTVDIQTRAAGGWVHSQARWAQTPVALWKKAELNFKKVRLNREASSGRSRTCCYCSSLRSDSCQATWSPARTSHCYIQRLSAHTAAPGGDVSVA